MATDAEQHLETSIASEELVCFVCGVPVSGKFYPLATCRLLCTKTPIIEKMSQLVGESYMVVITEDDIICRSCANLLNTLDRLEVELGSVRNVVLRFLEKKYELSDGELVNNRPIDVGQPPQITPGQGKLEQYSRKDNYMVRKRRQALEEIRREKENSSGDGTKHKSSSKNLASLLQCDKCKYTTSYNAFMIHHIRQHVKRKTVCDYCGVNIEQPGGTCPQKCNGSGGNIDNAQSLPEGQSAMATGGNSNIVISAVQLQENASGELASVSESGNSIGVAEKGNKTVTIEVPKIGQATVMQQVVDTGGNASTLCVMSDGSTMQQSQLMEVQKMEDEDSNAVYVQVVDVGKGNGTDDVGNLRKQVLTVADDGTVEMVEVLWDEMITPDIEEQNYLQQ